ncbi:nuclear localization sequence binding protein [Lithohypha guttulata]|nr:nuclear localization sequence binding protein [Lithohypha guttulata]
MSKTKSADKTAKSSKTDALSKTKDVGVKKSTKDVKPKDVAKVSEKDEKKSKKEKKDKKKVKEPTPEPESSSESDSSESEVETKKPAANGKVNGTKKAAAKDDSSDESDADTSDESASSEDDKSAPKKAGVAAKTNGAKVPAKKDESDDSASDSSESSDEEDAPTGAVLGQAPPVDQVDSSDDDDSSEDEKSAKPSGVKVAAKNDESEDDSDSESSDSSEDEAEKKPAMKANKRKAEEEAEPVTKKAKTDTAASGEPGKKNLFVGNLSWNIDEAWLRETFEEHGELSGVRVMYDKATQRAKGFGYVEFVNADDAAKAYEAKKGFELDGRAINLDWASVKPDNREQQDNRRKSYGDQLSEPTDTLFVGNLSFDVGQEQVSEAFTPYGTILSVRLPTDQATGSLKGFGYVTFQNVEEAAGALEAMQGAYISKRPIRLDYSQPRPPREEGGGFGGGRGRGGFGGGRGRGGDRGGRGGRGGFGGRGRGAPRGGRGGSTNRGGFGDFKGQRQTFD